MNQASERPVADDRDLTQLFQSGHSRDPLIGPDTIRTKRDDLELPRVEWSSLAP